MGCVAMWLKLAARACLLIMSTAEYVEKTDGAKGGGVEQMLTWLTKGRGGVGVLVNYSINISI